MISQAMEKMVRDLIEQLRTSLPSQKILILARSTQEMVSIAKYADQQLRRAEYFARISYEGDKRYIFQLSFPIQETDEPADLWVANLQEATPDTLAYFADGGDATDHVAWPDESGIYVVVPYERWRETWLPGSSLGEEHERDYPDPYFRPADVLYALQYEVGRPVGWVSPGPKVSVWEHLRRNVSIGMDDGKEVNEMPAKKKAAKAPKAKVKSPKKANKSAKKPN
jgi:hypothetical protein